MALDPTLNVIALSEASAKRQDDLRDKSERYVEAEIRHLSEMAELRATYDKELRTAEASRLDAIRQVDVLARDTAAERALTAIQTVATTVAETAETLRKSTSDIVTGITTRIAALEKSSYEGAGKGAGFGQSWQVLVAAAGILFAAVELFKHG